MRRFLCAAAALFLVESMAGCPVIETKEPRPTSRTGHVISSNDPGQGFDADTGHSSSSSSGGGSSHSVDAGY